MSVLNLFRSTALETRSATFENPSISLLDPRAWANLGGDFTGFTEEMVNEQTALGVPAVWAAVGVIAGTIASLPVHVFATKGDERVRTDTDPVSYLLSGTVNEDCLTTGLWLKWMVMRLHLEGRAICHIDRDLANRPKNIWPLTLSKVKIAIVGDRRVYNYERTPGNVVTLDAKDVLDFVLMPQADPAKHYNPLEVHRNAIGLTIAAERYAATNFNSGGIPLAVATMPAAAAAVMERAGDDLGKRIKKMRTERSPVLSVPTGVEIETIGSDPAKQQMIEVRRFQVEEIARIFNIPKSFLKDLSSGTFNNAEQQDLDFAKHTLTPILELIEQELNAKLFGRRNTNFIEFDMNGLMRGDFSSRMNGYATAIKNAMLTPNQVAKLENWPASKQPDADLLHIQGATVPLGQQSKAQPSAPEDNQPQKEEPANPVATDQ